MGGMECQLFCAILPKQLVNLKVCDMSQTNVLSSHSNIGSLTGLFTLQFVAVRTCRQKVLLFVLFQIKQCLIGWSWPSKLKSPWVFSPSANQCSQVCLLTASQGECCSNILMKEDYFERNKRPIGPIPIYSEDSISECFIFVHQQNCLTYQQSVRHKIPVSFPFDSWNKCKKLCTFFGVSWYVLILVNITYFFKSW